MPQKKIKASNSRYPWYIVIILTLMQFLLIPFNGAAASSPIDKTRQTDDVEGWKNKVRIDSETDFTTAQCMSGIETMIDDAKLELARGVWWQLGAATLAMMIVVLSLNILGDALRDALDPKLKGK